MLTKGKNVRINPNNPEAFGWCDYSGFQVLHKDMIWQYDWVGTSLKNLGYLVHPKYADKPNPQRMAMLLWPDPVPIKDPRPDPYPDSFENF